ncbi:MAG: hypothetical protein AB7G11_02695 [Phycisphaerales bacterium]
MLLKLKSGTTSKTIEVVAKDSSSSTGGNLTGLAYNTASLTAYYHRQGAASATAITLADGTVGTWSSGGFKAVDGTNLPGHYELGVPDAALAASATYVTIQLKGATNLVPIEVFIELDTINYQDSVRAGLTALPNAAAEASGGLITRGTSTGQLSVSGGAAQVAGVQLKKNTAFSGFTFMMVDATDGFTPETGVTVTATRSLDGAAFGACANSVSEIANGYYKIDLATTDLNGNYVVLNFAGSGCRTTSIGFNTQTA